jgi:hypothetical protein
MSLTGSNIRVHVSLGRLTSKVKFSTSFIGPPDGLGIRQCRIAIDQQFHTSQRVLTTTCTSFLCTKGYFSSSACNARPLQTHRAQVRHGPRQPRPHTCSVPGAKPRAPVCGCWCAEAGAGAALFARAFCDHMSVFGGMCVCVCVCVRACGCVCVCVCPPMCAK